MNKFFAEHAVEWARLEVHYAHLRDDHMKYLREHKCIFPENFVRVARQANHQVLRSRAKIRSLLAQVTP